jgi:RNA-directed DNA polymerase
MSTKKVIANWKAYFDSVGLKQDVSDKYLEYIGKIVINNAPVIFNFSHLCKLLGRSPRFLAAATNSNTSFYREFYIPKKSGGTRTIKAPYPSLMECQNWIYHNILKFQKIHPAAHGFTKDKSIITNAKVHLKQNQFLKIDIKDFFSSISINRIIYIFKKIGYTNQVAFYLSSLCTYEEYLPQGAPTSPIISNLISESLDCRLMNLAKKFNLRYTRYADDLAFSGGKISTKLVSYIKKIINQEGFEVNEEKTLLYCRKGKRILTGISIANEELAIPREYKRRLKQEIHFINKFGISSHIKKMKLKNPDYIESIIGKLNFWLSVENKNVFANNALKDLLKIKRNIIEE